MEQGERTVCPTAGPHHTEAMGGTGWRGRGREQIPPHPVTLRSWVCGAIRTPRTPSPATLMSPPPHLSILPPQGAYWPLPGVLSWVPNPDPAQAQRRTGRGSLGRMGPGRQCGPAAEAGSFLL